MAADEASHITFAPDDPSLPEHWKALIDGSMGNITYWNTNTNLTQYEKPTRPMLHLPPPPPGPPPANPILGAEYPQMRLHMRKSFCLSDLSPMEEDYFAQEISKMMQERGQHGHPQTMPPMSMPHFQLGPMPSEKMLPYAQMKTLHGIQFSCPPPPPPNIMHQKNIPPQGSPSSCQYLIQGHQLPQKQEYKIELGSRDDTDSHQVGQMGFSPAHHQLMHKVTATGINVPTSFKMEMVAVGLLNDNGHHYFSYFSSHDSSKNPSRHPYLFFLPQGAYVDITSCEGVLCFNSFDGRVVVCNLTTQQLQFLPPTRPLDPQLYMKNVVSCGFGYNYIERLQSD